MIHAGDYSKDKTGAALANISDQDIWALKRKILQALGNHEVNDVENQFCGKQLSIFNQGE